MKDEVYSWRVSRRLKSELQREARARGTSLSAVLELAAAEWLQRARSTVDDEELQRKLHAESEPYIGIVDGSRTVSH